ncbi:MAG: hypothetical protein SAJ37_13455 [Oscillatoria sp. PMC 1068.18]|nr:hypothetical protein [Oscillatoria sp. PMC 1068.18]
MKEAIKTSQRFCYFDASALFKSLPIRSPSRFDDDSQQQNLHPVQLITVLIDIFNLTAIAK